LYLALFFQQVISNQSESHWFTVLSVDFVIMTLATTALARSLHRRGVLAKLRHSAGQDVEGGCGQLRARALGGAVGFSPAGLP